MLNKNLKNRSISKKGFFRFFRSEKKGQVKNNNIYGNNSNYNSYYNPLSRPVWSSRDYVKFADEGYKKNVVAHRCINMIAVGAASVNFSLKNTKSSEKGAINEHSILTLINKPNPFISGKKLLETLYSQILIGGNSYLQKVRDSNGKINELYNLQPHKISILTSENGAPAAYRYNIGDRYKDFRVNRLSGKSDILHVKNFNPLDDLYGLSSMEAAAYSIDQHNEASAWNQSLLQNGARPSGALIVKNGINGEAGHLSDEQFTRIKQQMDESHAGATNAGRPLLLEGGLEWKEMSISPKDMDFINTKHSAARDIALAFGVPPQLLGIPGDATYSNMAEARLSLWEQTILPLCENMLNSLNNWLVEEISPELKLTANYDQITALSPRRDATWKRASNAEFLTDDEKRKMVGI